MFTDGFQMCEQLILWYYTVEFVVASMIYYLSLQIPTETLLIVPMSTIGRFSRIHPFMMKEQNST